MHGWSRRPADEPDVARGAAAPRARAAAGAEPLLQLQATAGNAAVTGLIRRNGRAEMAVQRLWDTDDEDVSSDEAPSEEGPSDEGYSGEGSYDSGPSEGGADGGSGGDGAEAEAPAPEASEGTNAIAGVEREVTEAIAPDNVADALSGYEESDEGSGMGDWNVPEEGLTAQAMHIQRDNTPQEPAPTREAKVGDVIKAIKPYLKPALDWLEENVVKTLKKIEAGEAVISIVVIAPIIVAPLTQKEPRNLALDQLDGTDITFGKIPNFKLEPKINNGQVTGGVITYDLAPALRKAGIPW